MEVFKGSVWGYIGNLMSRIIQYLDANKRIV
jgi:hypothetical protein